MTQLSLARPTEFTIAIVGGGFTGACLATHLLNGGDSSLRVVVLERANRQAAGWPTPLPATGIC